MAYKYTGTKQTTGLITLRPGMHLSSKDVYSLSIRRHKMSNGIYDVHCFANIMYGGRVEITPETYRTICKEHKIRHDAVELLGERGKKKTAKKGKTKHAKQTHSKTAR